MQTRPINHTDKAIEAIKQELAKPEPTREQIYEKILKNQLAKPEQEPVAWMYKGNFHDFNPSEWASPEFVVTPLYTAPSRKPEQEPILTDAGADTNISRGLEPKGSGMVTLNQPEQEPVAYVTGYHNGRCVITPLNPALIMPSGMALYIAPPRKEWVGLTGTEINHIFAANVEYPERMCHAIEAALKDKNNAV
jgi:hypothetical protein